MKNVVVNILAFVIAIVALISPLALSWLVTCGLVKVVTMCFDYQFTWGLGTGIWVILFIIQSIFTSVNKKE